MSTVIVCIQGSPLFAIRQRRVSTENTEGTIFLVGPLDFEAQSMYHLTLLAVVSFVLLSHVLTVR